MFLITLPVVKPVFVSDLTRQIKKLSRWEVIDVVRTMSTEAAKSGEEGSFCFLLSRTCPFHIIGQKKLSRF